MFELNTLRRTLCPLIEKVAPQVMAYKEASDREFVGVVDKSVEATRWWMHSQKNVYANNAAALKYYEVDGEHVPERGSYALRPDGRFGEWQLHYRLFPHEKGTALSVHWELNPLVRPVDHYNGHKWSPHQGKQKAREHLGAALQTHRSRDRISTYEHHSTYF